MVVSRGRREMGVSKGRREVVVSRGVEGLVRWGETRWWWSVAGDEGWWSVGEDGYISLL